MKDKILSFLNSRVNAAKPGFLCLIDPDKQQPDESAQLALKCQDNGVDVILVGGSLMVKDNFNETVKVIKNQVSIPVLVFPGIFNFVSPYADAILFLSMMSSRNSQLLIGEQVRTAPLIKKYDVEAIPTGYFLIESGSLTSVQFMSSSLPIPRTKFDIAVSHALAAQYLGMKLIFFDGGSGAKKSVPVEMIKRVKENISIPLIIGGGISTPEEAREKVEAGANFIVIGTAIENNNKTNLIKEFSEAIHS
ncbi:MAG: geranylgeranylglyceryl/heptaprenylglyceryl phosphate synthase [Candidatus Cloacimonetes bacterium]|nr:geranylgeranylglyceryl/heptaprenylglyceryl phosphate synthase [Candidatus Cloacimonadota bacterium]